MGFAEEGLEMVEDFDGKKRYKRTVTQILPA